MLTQHPATPVDGCNVLSVPAIEGAYYTRKHPKGFRVVRRNLNSLDTHRNGTTSVYHGDAGQYANIPTQEKLHPNRTRVSLDVEITAVPDSRSLLFLLVLRWQSEGNLKSRARRERRREEDTSERAWVVACSCENVHAKHSDANAVFIVGGLPSNKVEGETDVEYVRTSSCRLIETTFYPALRKRSKFHVPLPH